MNRCSMPCKFLLKYFFLCKQLRKIDYLIANFFQLSKEVTLSDSVKIISLPKSGFSLPLNTVVTITGFGSPQTGSATSPVLLKDQLVVSSLDHCTGYYSTAFGSSITTSNICTQAQAGHGTCVVSQWQTCIIHCKVYILKIYIEKFSEKSEKLIKIYISIFNESVDFELFILTFLTILKLMLIDSILIFLKIILILILY